VPQLLRLSVQSLYPGAGEALTCEGPEVDIVRWLYKRFPQIKHGHFRDLNELLEFLRDSVQGHEFDLTAQQLQKAWPRDEKDNADQAQGFFGSDAWKVHEDELLQDGWGIKAKWNQQARPSDKPVWGKRYPSSGGHRPGFEPEGASDDAVGRVGNVINSNGGYGQRIESQSAMAGA
jgi:hypothetical protein